MLTLSIYFIKLTPDIFNLVWFGVHHCICKVWYKYAKNGPIANLRQAYSQNYISNLHHLLRNGQMGPNLGSETKFRKKRLIAPGCQKYSFTNFRGVV